MNGGQPFTKRMHSVRDCLAKLFGDHTKHLAGKARCCSRVAADGCGAQGNHNCSAKNDERRDLEHIESGDMEAEKLGEGALKTGKLPETRFTQKDVPCHDDGECTYVEN